MELDDIVGELLAELKEGVTGQLVTNY